MTIVRNMVDKPREVSLYQVTRGSSVATREVLWSYQGNTWEIRKKVPNAIEGFSADKGNQCTSSYVCDISATVRQNYPVLW